MRRLQSWEEAPAGGLPAEGRQEAPGECPRAAAGGHEEQDPAEPGGGDRQGPAPGQGEIRVPRAARFKQGAVIARVERPSKSGCNIRDKNKAPPGAAGQDTVPGMNESLGMHGGRKITLDPLGALSEAEGPSPLRSETDSQNVHLDYIPGSQTSEPGPSQSVSQSNKYLKTGSRTRRPAGLAAGGERPRWLRGLERYFGRAEGGAWPEQNRRWMERERNRRVRRKLPSTPHTKKRVRKPGQAPAGPASTGPAGRTLARARADNGWECRVEIEWVDTQWLTPHCGGLSAGRGGRSSKTCTAAEESRGSAE